MDGQVARREDSELAKLLDQFVCVRVIQGYGLDLSLFQFDNQLTWSVFFLNADRTIYGRYGTRTGRNNPNDVTMKGFQKACEGALALHRDFPAVKAALAGKTGPTPAWKTPEATPALSTYKKGDTSRQGCIHCHKIHTGDLLTKRNRGEPISDADLWDFPQPQVVGLELDTETAGSVKSVAENSAAARAGFKAGDEIRAMNGQPVLSIADIQWVLQQSAETATLKTSVLRGGAKLELPLVLEKNWRRAGTYDYKAASWALGNRVLGFRSEAVDEAERENLKIAAGAMALKVKNIIPDWVKDGNHAVRKCGLLKNDVLTAVDGRSDFLNESVLMAYAIQEKKPSSVLKLQVRRNGKDVLIDLPVGK